MKLIALMWRRYFQTWDNIFWQMRLFSDYCYTKTVSYFPGVYVNGNLSLGEPDLTSFCPFPNTIWLTLSQKQKFLSSVICRSEPLHRSRYYINEYEFHWFASEFGKTERVIAHNVRKSILYEYDTSLTFSKLSNGYVTS